MTLLKAQHGVGTEMRKSHTRPIVIGILLLLLLTGASLTLVLFLQAPTLTVEVTGKPGQGLVGTIEADGTCRDVTATLPATFTVKGRGLAFQFLPADASPDDTITVKAYIGDRHVTTCAGPGVEGGVSGIWHQWTRGIPRSRIAEIGRGGPSRVESAR
jgi:hypothetical protein